MAAPDFSHKWETLPPAERRLSGIRLAELADPAAEAQAIALALREALETPGKTAALVTPDRQLAGAGLGIARAVGHRRRRQRRQAAVARPRRERLLLGIASAAAEELAPVPLLALLKHPLVGGEGDERLAWLETRPRARPRAARAAAARRASPGSTRIFAREGRESARVARARTRCRADRRRCCANPSRCRALAGCLRAAAEALAGDRGVARAGRAAWPPNCWPSCRRRSRRRELIVAAEDAVPLLRQLLDARAVRPPYGGHPRIFIWGLLEARLQRADLVVLGGLNEGVWPALPAPDPWLPPKVRANARHADARDRGSGLPRTISPARSARPKC